MTVGFGGVSPSSYTINTVYLWTAGPEEAVLRVALKPHIGIRVEDLKQRLRRELPERLAGWFQTHLREDGLSDDQIAALNRQIERLIATNDGFVTDTPRHLRRIVSHFRAQLGIERFEAPRCNAPWVSAVLEPNGDLRPCFFHPIVGSANNGLDTALNNPASTSFRRDLDVATNPTCQRCVCSLHLQA